MQQSGQIKQYLHCAAPLLSPLCVNAAGRVHSASPGFRLLAEAVFLERVWMDQRQPIPEERAEIAAAQTQDRSYFRLLACANRAPWKPSPTCAGAFREECKALAPRVGAALSSQAGRLPRPLALAPH